MNRLKEPKDKKSILVQVTGASPALQYAICKLINISWHSVKTGLAPVVQVVQFLW